MSDKYYNETIVAPNKLKDCMESLLEVLGNSHFEAYIGGPIAGFIVGLLFAAFGSRPPSGGGQSPSQVQVQIINHTENVYSQNANVRNRQTTSDDSLGLAFGLALLGAIAVFMFTAYLPEISFGLTFLITSVAMFSITVLVCSFLSGQLTAWVWCQHVILPFLMSVAAFAIVFKANAAISPRVIEYARGLINADKLTIAIVVNGAITFAKQIGSNYMQWMACILVAFVCSTMGTMYAFFQCLHYVALANVQNSASPAWVRLAVWTRRFCGWISSFVGIALLAFGWYCATGGLYAIMQ